MTISRPLKGRPSLSESLRDTWEDSTMPNKRPPHRDDDPTLLDDQEVEPTEDALEEDAEEIGGDEELTAEVVDSNAEDEAYEMGLWEGYKGRGDMVSRDRLAQKYIPLVKYVAGKLAAKLPQTIEFDDLVGYGYFGLLNAIDRFDPARGIKFKTYAVTRIRGSIYDELRSIDWIPRGLRQKGRELDATLQMLEEQMGRVPRDEEIAEHMGMTPEEVRRLKIKLVNATIVPASDPRNQSNEDGESRNLIDNIESHPSLAPENMVERDETKKLIIEKLRELPQRERKVLVLYYYEDLTLKEIGTVLKVTESRVSQLHTRAIARLRNLIDEVRKQWPRAVREAE